MHVQITTSVVCFTFFLTGTNNNQKQGLCNSRENPDSVNDVTKGTLILAILNYVSRLQSFITFSVQMLPMARK